MRRQLQGASKRSAPQRGRLRRLLASVDVAERDLSPYIGFEGPPTELITYRVRVTAEERAQLRDTAAFFGITPPQIIRMFMIAGLREHGARIEDARELGYNLG